MCLWGGLGLWCPDYHSDSTLSFNGLLSFTQVMLKSQDLRGGSPCKREVM